ncbi:MAG: hypothetical protein QW521_03625 [Desulfurococcaceae archaeon]
MGIFLNIKCRLSKRDAVRFARVRELSEFSINDVYRRICDMRSDGIYVSYDWMRDMIREEFYKILSAVFGKDKVKFRLDADVDYSNVLETFVVKVPNADYVYHVDIRADNDYVIEVRKKRLPRYVIADIRVSKDHYSYIFKLYDKKEKRVIDEEKYGDMEYFGMPDKVVTHSDALESLLKRNNLSRNDVMIIDCEVLDDSICSEM